MIEISPAILVNEEKEFKRELDLYLKFAKQIDIDINIDNDQFPGQTTESVEFVIKSIKDIDHFFGIHLMVSEPLEEIEKFLQIKNSFKGIFYIHQEANFKAVLESELIKIFDVGMTVKAESQLRSIDFYKNFPEVQLMTIETGKQGNSFKPEILERVEWLRESGFEGKISIDGSVNLRSAEYIKQYELDRVSVGSYFSKAEDAESNMIKLNLALNMNNPQNMID